MIIIFTAVAAASVTAAVSLSVPVALPPSALLLSFPLLLLPTPSLASDPHTTPETAASCQQYAQHQQYDGQPAVEESSLRCA